MSHQIGTNGKSSSMGELGSVCGHGIASDKCMPSCVPVDNTETLCNPLRSLQ